MRDTWSTVLWALFAPTIVWARILDLHTDCLVRDSYDYVVVGGGTSGMVLANRLSEDPSIHVAVLEAGESGIGNDNISCPGLIEAALSSNINWAFETVPQVFANNTTVAFPRGRVLGGSSSINGHFFTRGSKMEYDAFEALGNPGWNWESLVAAVRKAEQLQLPSKELVRMYNYTFDPNSYGHHGSIYLSFSPWWSTPYANGFFQSAERVGHHVILDSAGGNKTGLSYAPGYVNSSGIRTTAFSAFYPPTRHNLDIYTFAHVSHLHFSDSSAPLHASAVEFLFPNGSRGVLRVRKEVVLSAGSIQTPQVLELSGIGDPAVLDALHIPVKYANPGVGANLQDHPVVNTVWSMKPGFFNQSFSDVLGNKSDFDAALALWRKNGTGPSSSGTPQVAYLSLRDIAGDEVLKRLIFSDNPVIEYCPIPANGENVPAPGVGYGLFQNAVQHELSRGTVHITSTNPLTPPAIDPQYLAHEFDTWLMAKSIVHLRNITSQDLFTAAGFDQEVLPGDDIRTFSQVKTHVKGHIESELHPIGTAAMLPERDGGVVDPHGRVYGTRNVRIVDASTIPMHISAHTTNIVYSFALKIAELMNI